MRWSLVFAMRLIAVVAAGAGLLLASPADPVGNTKAQNKSPTAESGKSEGPQKAANHNKSVPETIPPSQMFFSGPAGMQVTWDVKSRGAFDSQPLAVPARYNFPRGFVYVLKLTKIPGHPGIELYPTLEVVEACTETEAYLGHYAIPVEFTDEDFKEALGGKLVVKITYVPKTEPNRKNPEVDTIVSTKLGPGVDPIEEAARRGRILAMVRLTKDRPKFPTGEQACDKIEVHPDGS